MIGNAWSSVIGLKTMQLIFMHILLKRKCSRSSDSSVNLYMFSGLFSIEWEDFSSSKNRLSLRREGSCSSDSSVNLDMLSDLFSLKRVYFCSSENSSETRVLSWLFSLKQREFSLKRGRFSLKLNKNYSFYFFLVVIVSFFRNEIFGFDRIDWFLVLIIMLRYLKFRLKSVWMKLNGNLDIVCSGNEILCTDC